LGGRPRVRLAALRPSEGARYTATTRHIEVRGWNAIAQFCFEREARLQLRVSAFDA